METHSLRDVVQDIDTPRGHRLIVHRRPLARVLRAVAEPDVKRTCKTKCSYHQVKWHKGDGCMKSGEACKFVHDLCTSQAEYDALYKPWEHTDRSNRGDRSDRSDRSNRDKPESPRPAAPKAGAKPKVFLACADFNSFCRLGNACPKRQVGGTGECRKVHCDTEEADQHIDNWKIKLAAVKPAPKKKGTPRGEAGE